MRRHGAPDFRLFADNHALQDSWVLEAEFSCYRSVERGECCFFEWGGEFVQVVPDFVDGEVFWFVEGV